MLLQETEYNPRMTGRTIFRSSVLGVFLWNASAFTRPSIVALGNGYMLGLQLVLYS